MHKGRPCWFISEIDLLCIAGEINRFADFCAIWWKKRVICCSFIVRTQSQSQSIINQQKYTTFLVHIKYIFIDKKVLLFKLRLNRMGCKVYNCFAGCFMKGCQILYCKRTSCLDINDTSWNDCVCTKLHKLLKNMGSSWFEFSCFKVSRGESELVLGGLEKFSIYEVGCS